MKPTSASHPLIRLLYLSLTTLSISGEARLGKCIMPSDSKVSTLFFITYRLYLNNWVQNAFLLGLSLEQTPEWGKEPT